MTDQLNESYRVALSYSFLIVENCPKSTVVHAEVIVISDSLETYSGLQCQNTVLTVKTSQQQLVQPHSPVQTFCRNL